MDKNPPKEMGKSRYEGEGDEQPDRGGNSVRMNTERGTKLKLNFVHSLSETSKQI